MQLFLLILKLNFAFFVEIGFEVGEGNLDLPFAEIGEKGLILTVFEGN